MPFRDAGSDLRERLYKLASRISTSEQRRAELVERTILVACFGTDGLVGRHLEREIFTIMLGLAESDRGYHPHTTLDHDTVSR